MNEAISADGTKGRIGNAVEIIIVITLCALASTIYLSPRRATVYDVLVPVLLLLWRFGFHQRTERTIPTSIIIWTALYLLSCLLGALLSEDRRWELTEYRRYIHFLTAGLLFIAPLSGKNRKLVITFFLICAAAAGVAGILQYIGLMNKGWERPHGFAGHPILYAAILAPVCGSAIIMLFICRHEAYQSKTGRLFLLLTIICTFSGIIASGSRGVWIALATACGSTLFLYDRRKAIYFSLSLFIILMTLFSISNPLRQRITSIVTSVYTEKDEKDSTVNRIELWKGALLIFKDSPLLGSGSGNFESRIKLLVQEGELKKIPIMVHAHNIFLQALATRGLIGLIITIGFLSSLIAWGLKEIESNGKIGGYVIILCTLLTIIGGLTEDNIELSKYLAVFCLCIGLLGIYETKHDNS